MPDERAFDPTQDANFSVSTNAAGTLVNPPAQGLLNANPELGSSADIQEIQAKTQNQTATSSNTNFAGNVAVSGDISLPGTASLGIALSSINSEIQSVQEAVSDALAAKSAFSAIKISLVQNGEALPGEYGYIVLEKDSEGLLSPLYLSQSEYDEIFGG